MKRSRFGLSAVALIGSVAVHGLVAWWLATRPVLTTTRRAAVVQTVEFSLLEPVVATATVESEPAAGGERERVGERASTETSTTTRTRTRTMTGTETVTSVEVAAPASAETVASVEVAAATSAGAEAVASVEAAPTTTGERKVRDLSPLAAALTLRDSLLGTNRCEAALSGSAGCAGGGLSADAGSARPKGPLAARDELSALRKELHLKPRADGSYTFDSASFSATVEPDGRVTFEDKIRDLNTLVERAFVGSQINTSEKRRFMESTAELRERLAVAAEEQNQRRGKLALQSTLRRVMADTGLSLAQKRGALFSLWDDCASDVSGSQAQAAIESFVREHLPEGSALAYSTTELTQLNRRRVSRRVFDPYAVADGGALPG